MPDESRQTADAEPAGLPSDDRTPYDVALAVIQTVSRHSEELRDEKAVMDAILEYKGPAFHEYLAIIARSRHSIFYHQLQELYEFAKQSVRPDARDAICFLAGGEFAQVLLRESVHPLQQAAAAHEGAFQKTVVEVVRSYLVRFTGDKYSVEIEFAPEEIRTGFTWLDAEVVRCHLEPYGLDAVRCFRNSVDFIAGAIEHFLSRLTADYDPARFRIEHLEGRSVVHMPVRESDHFDYEALIGTFSSHLEELEAHRRAPAEEGLASELVLGSSTMRETWNRIRRASRSDELILLRGESGTGKSFLARRIHDLSPRRDGPFIEVGLTSDVGSDNLTQSDLFGHEKGAFTGATGQKTGLFSLADGGTIFLDEIGDASAELQAKLLRVLESRRFKRLGGTTDVEVDVRVIAATNRNLEQMVEEGGFREDLYFRINVIPVRLPPLRERRDDVPALTRYLLERTQAGKARRLALPDELCRRLSEYDWPGNIRELEHALKHALALAEGAEIALDDLPATVIDALGDGAGRKVSPQAPGGGEVIDVAALRSSIHATNPLAIGAEMEPVDVPAHIEHAKRQWLAVLIDELDGDLALIAKYWDRGSEKTLRNLMKSYGLVEQLNSARARARGRHS